MTLASSLTRYTPSKACEPPSQVGDILTNYLRRSYAEGPNFKTGDYVDSPSKADPIADEKLWQLVKVSVSAAIRMVIDVISDGKTLPQYSNYPIIERNNDGSFRGRSVGPAPDAVPNYGRIFGPRDGSSLPGPTFYT